MIRRSPTRIELRLDDLSEWENLKKRREAEARKQAGTGASSGSAAAHKTKESATHERHERIGYLPQPVYPELSVSFTPN